MNTRRFARTRTFRTLGLAAILGAAAALVAGTPAEAHGPYRGRGHDGRHAAHAAVVHAPRHAQRVLVPARIAVADAYAYRRWYAGSAYYSPHRHAHVVYRFPVWVNGTVVYQPYAYCDGRLHVDAELALPPLALGVRVGPEGGGIAVSAPGFGLYVRSDGR